jgi:maltooligosyltrehalose synthase
VGDASEPAIPASVWDRTRLVLPAAIRNARDLLTDRHFDKTVTVTALFAHLPVALVSLD